MSLSKMKLPISSETSGLIPIHKPVGMTSTDVSRLVKRRFGRLKLGHVGTLDPDADGVLTLLVGCATKVQDYLLKLPKVYSFEIKLGTSTDTLDASGQATDELPWGHVTREMIQGIAPNFVGSLIQTPPIFSAVKYRGKELYKYARSGRSSNEVPLENLNRPVEIFNLTLDDCSLPLIRMTATCGKGTYIRTLAHDIAKALGTAGHVSKLTRLESAGFKLSDCISIEQLLATSTDLADVVVPLDDLAIGLPTWYLNDSVLLKRLMNGQTVVVPIDDKNHPCLGRASHLLVKSVEGRSLGVVSATALDTGQFKLHLQRGFQCHQAS